MQDYSAPNRYAGYSALTATTAVPSSQVVTKSAQIYIVDDDDLSIWLIRELLKDVNVQIMTFPSGEQFLENYSPGVCECLIMDVKMPGTDGLGIQRLLLQRGICVPIIFVTAGSGVSEAVEAMRHGAFDFLQKPLHGRELTRVVRAALDKSRDLHATRRRLAVRDARLAMLTPKEREILLEVVAGYSSKDIAARMKLSQRTVENHRAHIYAKLHVNSMAGLARMFRDLIPTTEDGE